MFIRKLSCNNIIINCISSFNWFIIYITFIYITVIYYYLGKVTVILECYNYLQLLYNSEYMINSVINDLQQSKNHNNFITKNWNIIWWDTISKETTNAQITYKVIFRIANDAITSAYKKNLKRVLQFLD